MGNTSIQWTATPRPDGTLAPGYTFNGWIGCHRVSEACKACYAADHTFARVSKSRGVPLWGEHAWRHVTSDANWKKPIQWNREAAAAGERRKVFAHSLSDVFENRDDLIEPRARLAALVGATPHLNWLFLTKRPEHAVRLWRQACSESTGRLPCVCGSHGRSELCGEIDISTGQWASNIWIGTTTENQAMAEQRLPHLLRVPAVVKFLSVEPLLEAIDLDPPHCQSCYPSGMDAIVDAEDGTPCCTNCDSEAAFGWWLDPLNGGISWVIVGGESGPKARPFDVAWARDVVRQCRDAGVPVFVKQMGSAPCDHGTLGELPTAWPAGTHTAAGYPPRIMLNDRAGGDPEEWPEDLRMREWPVPGSAQ